MNKTITIGFSRPKNKIFPIISWAIRLYQGWTDYSHIYVQFYAMSLNRVLIYEAVGSGVRFIGRKLWNKSAQEVISYTIDVKEENYKEIMKYCIDNAGNKYGYLQNIGIFISNIFGLKQNIWRKHTNCAEEIAKLLKLEGYEISKSVDLVTPLDIEKILKSTNQVKLH